MCYKPNVLKLQNSKNHFSNLVLYLPAFERKKNRNSQI